MNTGSLGLTGFALLLSSFMANAVEVMPWGRIPLSVPLTVGQERVVFVDETVRVGVPAYLTDRLRVQSANGAVYLRASQEIASTRIQLQLQESGENVLLDISAVPGDQVLEPVRIVREPITPSHEGRPEHSGPSANTPIPVTLVRYAAQSLYAPLRTLEPLAGVQRVPLRLKSALPLFTEYSINATPMAAWRLNDFWVTAVKLQNQSTGWITLDPRALQASLFSASFQHEQLGPHGRPEDTTVAYLVTRSAGLEKALWLPTSSAEENQDAR
ncbi:TIGR03749 family integrating conjugative element protein [Pseudomonas sp. LRF_L74]|uniref:TIGR03749 family integrating conjugative element protein n=1 Tax=Pseudomonas sp. LRF_L74 TaxID=3369422 RepID=UPI003F5DA319